IVYLAVLIGVTIHKSRQVKSHADFMVAGRSVPVLFLVGTLVCTWIGSGSLFGGAGLAYRTGIAELWFSFGGWIGLIVVYLIAHRVRRIAQFTVPDILETRYNSVARILGTLTIVLAYITIAAYQFRGGGWVLSFITDGAISAETGMYITALVIVLFTAFAGMTSIVTVDIFNGVIITLGVLFALPYLVFSHGGPSAIINGLPSGHLQMMGGHNALWALGVAMPTFLLLMGESGLYQKFFSAKDAKSARKAVIGMVGGIILIETVLALLAITGKSVFPELSDQTSMLGRAASETIILYIARYGLPVILGAILLAAAVAIVLSTGNTFLLVPSTNVSHDLYERFINPKASEKQKLKVQRISIVVFGGLGLILLTQFQTVLAMALYAYSLVGAALTPALLAAFLWKRVTAEGGVACIAGGMVTVIGLAAMSRLGVDFTLNLGGTDFDFASSDYVVIPGVLVSLTLLILVSLATPKSPADKVDPFFETAKS
ncbi:MAG: sodium:solute symporter family protein, partial [Acidobacteria bacterium]|nr:sodium:solute symporter family protein [Acidobacteriota bacterium]